MTRIRIRWTPPCDNPAMPKDRSSDRHKLHRHSVGYEDADWAELIELTKDGDEAHDVLRRLLRAFLKRPGAKMPQRKTYDDAR